MSDESTHGDFADILAVAHDSLHPICHQLRELIRDAYDAPYEIVWPKHRIASFGIGPKKMTEHYAYIGIQKNHVNLGFYHGADLPDPKNLLEGTGKKLRHIKLTNLAPKSVPAIKALLKAAVVDRLQACE